MCMTNERCSFCKGSGKAERLEERRQDGWYPNTMLDHATADASIAADRWAPVRWVDCACPSCDGSGSVLVEHFTAKIF